MKRTIRATAVYAMAFIALVLMPSAATACRCVPMSQARHAELSDVVAVADVVESRDDGYGPLRFRLIVAESWKQRLPSSVIVSSRNTSCVAILTTGQRYLVYLRRTTDGFTTGRCSGTLPIARAGEAITALRRRYW